MAEEREETVPSIIGKLYPTCTEYREVSDRSSGIGSINVNFASRKANLRCNLQATSRARIIEQ